MKKNLFRSGFNLIEVTMAIAIVGIGIAGIMALFPPAIDASKNADFHNYTGTMVDNVAVYLGYKLNTNWGTFLDGLPSTKAAAPKPGQETSTDGWTATELGGVFTTSQPGVLGIKSHDGTIAAHVRVWKDTNMGKGYYNQTEVKTDDTNYRAKLIIELSWPIAKAYDDGAASPKVLRETQEFVYEFNKPE